MNSLLELLVVEDGSHLAVAVARPVGLSHLGPRLAHIRPVTAIRKYFRRKYFSLCVVFLRVAGKLSLSLDLLALCLIVAGAEVFTVNHLLKCT